MAISDLTSSATSTIGRYFSALATVPSLLFVAFLALLVRSGAWSGEPDWGAAVRSFADTSFGDVVVLVVASLLISMAVHPVQFLATQLLEGYWGAGYLGIRFAERRTAYYWRRRSFLIAIRGHNADPLIEPSTRGTEDESPRVNIRIDEIKANRAFREAERLLAYYPMRSAHVMPTRLGNVLRAWELRAGHQFALDAVSTIPYFALVADADHRALLDDRRTSLDLCVRVCVLGLLATGIGIVFLWGRGLDLLVALAPLLVAYLAYRGSVNVAVEYGIAMSALIALNREQLYRALALELPATLEEERTVTAPTVMALVGPPVRRADAATRLNWPIATPAGSPADTE